MSLEEPVEFGRDVLWDSEGTFKDNVHVSS